MLPQAASPSEVSPLPTAAPPPAEAQSKKMRADALARVRDLDGVASVVAARLERLQLTKTLRLRPSPLSQTVTLAADWVTAFVLTAACCAILAWAGRTGGLRLEVPVVLATTLCCALRALGAYRTLDGPCRVEAVTAIIKASALSLVVLLSVFPLFGFDLSLVLCLVIAVPALVVGLIAQRLFLRTIEHRIESKNLTPALIYGAGFTGRLLARKLLQETRLGLEPVGFLDDDLTLKDANVRVGEGETGVRLPVLGTGEALGDAMGLTHAAAVFIAIPSSSSERIAAIAEGVTARGGTPCFVPSAGDQPFASLRMTMVGGIPVLAPRQATHTRFYALAKRIVDVVGSLLLLVATAPILLASALILKLTSAGPAIFTQRRVGLNGKLFTIYKLRSMHRSSASYAFHPDSAGDMRVTKVGRWLRRLSFDELPQLYNILRGDMSFVGPRPEMPFIVATYNDTQLQRLMVKPGLTGLWQISGDRAFRIHDHIYYDLYYVEHQSLVVDLAIFIMTPFMLLTQRSAK